MLVDIFIPCFIDQLYPQTGLNFVKVLQKAGCTVHYNNKQTCCGQPSFNSGYRDEARSIAEKFISDFDTNRYIVSPSASCTGYIRRHYPTLFENTALAEKAQNLSNRVYEMSDFLVTVLKIVDLGAQFNAKVTWHDSCAALREYGIKQEPRKLLRAVKGLELIEMAESETCCGFGGTFAVKHSAISTAMVEQKTEYALASGAEYVATTEASCLMNIEGYIKKNKVNIKAIHLADILANGY